MSFDDIINKATTENKDHLIKQALKKQEYNRNYQRRLREAAKLATLERKIDANLHHVFRYIKTNYADAYADYVVPVQDIKPVSNPAFDNWLLLSAEEYKSIQYAFDVSSLEQHMSFDEFSELFEDHFKPTKQKTFAKITSDKQ